jgi:hypothetical protein
MSKPAAHFYKAGARMARGEMSPKAVARWIADNRLGRLAARSVLKGFADERAATDTSWGGAWARYGCRLGK